MRAAWALGDAGRAITELEQLICSLDHQRPGDAASPRKSLAETLTVARLGISCCRPWSRPTPRIDDRDRR